ncbi:uncharacterized protein [Solanum tuberosum]|uniref:uncharacterized protein n=1 Tax=Solanum tuberosum TaxID=4113 RepID=UPI00073A2D47|nr:PREDICTED: uncharacterized protein LOC107057667 [Solanum tuberosum]
MTSGITNYKLKGSAQVHAMGSQMNNLDRQKLKVSYILGQNGGTSVQRLHILQMSESFWKNCVRRSCLKLVTNYYTTVLTKFKTGVGCTTFIHKLQDHLPETRAVRRLQHSSKAICSELPQQSSHKCDQSSTQSCGDSVFSDERPSVKMKLFNMWNSKLHTQGVCTSTRYGESKEELSCLTLLVKSSEVAPTKNSMYLIFWDKWSDFRPEITSATGTVLRIRIIYSMSLLASCILLVLHWFLISLIKLPGGGCQSSSTS